MSQIQCLAVILLNVVNERESKHVYLNVNEDTVCTTSHFVLNRKLHKVFSRMFTHGIPTGYLNIIVNNVSQLPVIRMQSVKLRKFSRLDVLISQV